MLLLYKGVSIARFCRLKFRQMNRNSVRIKDSKREAKALILDGITVKFIELLSLFDGYDSNETKIRSSSSKLLVVEAVFIYFNQFSDRVFSLISSNLE